MSTRIWWGLLFLAVGWAAFWAVVGVRELSSSGGGAPPGAALLDQTTAAPALTPQPPMVGSRGGGEAADGLPDASPPAPTPAEGTRRETEHEAAPRPAVVATQALMAAPSCPRCGETVDAPVQSTAGVPLRDVAGSNPATGGSLQAWIAASNWPREHWARLEARVLCESRGQPGANTNPPYVGLLQVDPRLHGPVPADPVAQLNQGYEVFKKQGAAAWPNC